MRFPGFSRMGTLIVRLTRWRWPLGYFRMQESFLNPPDYVLNSFIWIWIARSKKFQFENRKIRPCAWPLNTGPKSKLFRKLTSWYFVIRTDFWFWIFSDLWIKKNFRKTIREEKNWKIYFWKKYFFWKNVDFWKN